MSPSKDKKKKKTPNQKDGSGRRLIATNRKARHDYDFLETFEAGIVLQGTEVKSLREAQVQVRDSYARIEDGEMWMHGVHISPYEHAGAFGAHDPDRVRKLLLHRIEIERIRGKLQHEKLTLVPVTFYFKDGRAKVELALARGRHLYDKRKVLAQRDADMEIRRAARRLGVPIHT